MKRVLFSLVALACIAASAASAQKARLSLGAGGIMPSGDYSTADNFGWELMGAVEVGVPKSPIAVRADLMWRVVAMSSTFAGNLLLIGSMANLIVAERAEARGVRIGFGEYARIGVPISLLTITWGILVILVTS